MFGALLRALARKPDVIIGSLDNPYLLRWHLLPRNPVFNIYLHKFCRSDDDRALHDHPWLFNISILLRGDYTEHLPGWVRKHRRPGAVYFRPGRAPHRVALFSALNRNERGDFYSREVPVWTLFITGPRVRQWGFYCPNGWRHWRLFTQVHENGNQTGRGCE